jgi:uncharacterized protein
MILYDTAPTRRGAAASCPVNSLHPIAGQDCRHFQTRAIGAALRHADRPALPESAMLSSPLSAAITPILLLVGSNVFMTTAWYWHLRYRSVPLFTVILISWGLAFIEYCLAVPANRYGSAVYSAAQLKTIQEVITLTVFALFSVAYLHQPITWNQAVGFTFIAAGAFFVFRSPL